MKTIKYIVTTAYQNLNTLLSKSHLDKQLHAYYWVTVLRLFTHGAMLISTKHRNMHLQKLQRAEGFSMKCIALSGPEMWTCKFQSYKGIRLEI